MSIIEEEELAKSAVVVKFVSIIEEEVNVKTAVALEYVNQNILSVVELLATEN